MNRVKIRVWLKERERTLSFWALLAGFVVDNLTLRRADLPGVNAILAFYLVVIAVSIILQNRPTRKRLLLWIKIWLPLVIPFSFGNLFSGFFVLYFHSASLPVSWPFLLLLLVLLLGSEYGKKHYTRLNIQLAVFYLALFAFLIYHLPVIIGRLSAGIFLLSGVLSLAAMGLYLLILLALVPKEIQPIQKKLTGGVLLIFILVNIFYFTNVLPPIPLLLKDFGVYHSIARAGNDFVFVGEKKAWREYLGGQPIIHLRGRSEPLFAYSAVFAPADFSLRIVHNWEHYDETKNRWVSQSRIPLALAGGREEGHRSYSQKNISQAGWWRVSIENERGQVIGRKDFKVVPGD